MVQATAVILSAPPLSSCPKQALNFSELVFCNNPSGGPPALFLDHPQHFLYVVSRVISLKFKYLIVLLILSYENPFQWFSTSVMSPKMYSGFHHQISLKSASELSLFLAIYCIFWCIESSEKSNTGKLIWLNPMLLYLFAHRTLLYYFYQRVESTDLPVYQSLQHQNQVPLSKKWLGKVSVAERFLIFLFLFSYKLPRKLSVLFLSSLTWICY